MMKTATLVLTEKERTFLRAALNLYLDACMQRAVIRDRDGDAQGVAYWRDAYATTQEIGERL